MDECLTDPAMGGTLKGASVVDSATDGEVGATVNETAITLSKMMLGLGFIGLPKAVCSGWLTSPILFMLAAFINGYTTQLIGSLMEITKPKALELGNHAPDLAFCGLVAFGEKSRACFSAFIIGGIWMVLIWALLLSTYFLTSLFPGFWSHAGSYFLSCCVLPDHFGSIVLVCTFLILWNSQLTRDCRVSSMVWWLYEELWNQRVSC